MKKIWIWMIALVVLFTGCGADKADTPMDEPYALEAEYGDSGIPAEFGSYLWHSDGEILRQEGDVPVEELSEVPYLNMGSEKNIKLLFDKDPDTLQIRYWCSSDGYQTAHEVEKPRTKLAVPEEEASYLYEVKATWEQSEKHAWGSSTYYFRLLPQASTGDQSEELAFYHLVQLKPEELFGIEMDNILDQEKKICQGVSKTAVLLDYLQEHLSTTFRPVEGGEPDYRLKLAAVDGTNYVLEYGGEGKNAWVRLGETAYEAGVMDLYSVWTELDAKVISTDEGWKDAYLQVSEQRPADQWGEDIRFGYLQGLDTEVLYDEILLEVDTEGNEVYTLKRGTLGQTLPLAENCEFWILKDHFGPFCQVEQETLWQWSEEADYDVLFSIYVVEDQVVAICEELRQ